MMTITANGITKSTRDRNDCPVSYIGATPNAGNYSIIDTNGTIIENKTFNDNNVILNTFAGNDTVIVSNLNGILRVIDNGGTSDVVTVDGVVTGQNNGVNTESGTINGTSTEMNFDIGNNHLVDISPGIEFFEIIGTSNSDTISVNGIRTGTTATVYAMSGSADIVMINNSNGGTINASGSEMNFVYSNGGTVFVDTNVEFMTAVGSAGNDIVNVNGVRSGTVATFNGGGGSVDQLNISNSDGGTINGNATDLNFVYANTGAVFAGKDVEFLNTYAASNSTVTVNSLRGITTPTIFGGSGNDTVIVNNVSVGQINVSGSTMNIDQGSNKLLFFGTGLENLTVLGTSGNDNIKASGSRAGTSVSIAGLDGNDVLTGSTGIETINGGLGADLINGGGGNDTISAGATNTKRVLYVNFDGIFISHADLYAYSANGTQWDPKNIDDAENGITVEAFQASNSNRANVIQDTMSYLYDDFAFYSVDVVRFFGNTLPVNQMSATLFIGNAVIENPFLTLSQEASLRGIACDLDTNNVNWTDLAFVRREYSGTDTQIAHFAANTGAHEVGHLLGLEHINPNGDLELMRDGGFASDVQNASANYAFNNVAYSTTSSPSVLQNSRQLLLTNLS